MRFPPKRNISKGRVRELSRTQSPSTKRITMPKTYRPESLLTEEELAEFLNISLRSIRLWIQEQRLPYYRFGWRLIRIRLSDVEAFLNRSLVPARTVPIPVRSRLAEKKQQKENNLQEVIA